MQIRIRFPEGRRGNAGAKAAPLLPMVGGVLTLLAVCCFALAAWRLTFDLGWTGEFAVAHGLLSHWQVWLALTIAFANGALRLMRPALPRI